MPICLESAPCEPATAGSLRIGVVNNMSDEALRATERQFATLLNAASTGMEIRLSFYTLPGIPRSPGMASHVARLYGRLPDLWRGSLDGLIVTGREPATPRLEREAWWPVFTDLVEWAREGVSSSVWSCLAAHAAVLCLDGVERVRYEEKLTGLISSVQTAQHPLLAGLPSTLRLPHSRWNTLQQAALIDAGYQVLAGGEEAGADIFFKQEKSLLVFLQGHPEYRADTLSREYRRDVSRYVRGESSTYPSLPSHYFDADTAGALAKLRTRALAGPSPQILAEVCQHLDAFPAQHSWLEQATGFYGNWLHGLAARKYGGPDRGRTDVPTTLKAIS